MLRARARQPAGCGAHRRDGAGRTGVRPGFTLMELLLVMAIAGIVMSFSAARIDWVAMEVNSTARQVSTTLLAAQRLAVLRQHEIIVAVDTIRNALRIHEDRNNNGRIDPNESLNYVQLEDAAAFGRGGAPGLPFGSQTVSFTKTQTGFPSIAFRRSGSASEMGGFYITSKRALRTGQHATDARALDINRATGRASYFMYDGSTWRRGF